MKRTRKSFSSKQSKTHKDGGLVTALTFSGGLCTFAEVESFDKSGVYSGDTKPKGFPIITIED